MTPQSRPKPKKRFVQVYEGDDENGAQQLYKGPDRRTYDQDYPRGGMFLGFPIMDYIKIGLYIGGVVVFLVKADQRLNSLEINQVKMSTILDHLVGWTENADSFNSAQYGTPFQNGKPVNDRYSEWMKNQNKKGR